MREMQLDTLTLRYWQDFELVDSDLEHLSDLLIEEEAPLTLEDLSQRIMAKRARDEKAFWEDREAKGRLYQPRDAYAEGDRLVFPALGDAVGTVVGVRPGRHPDYAPFDVIQVGMEGNGDSREFASNLSQAHALNLIQVDQGEDVDLEDLDALAATLYERYGHHVAQVVMAGLRESPEFVSLGEEWFLKGFLLPIEEGHLNLAEAVLDLAAGFSTSREILEVLEMPSETSDAVQIFSLNHALASDKEERFRFAGTKSRMEWCLPRVADSRTLRFGRGPKDISLDHRLEDVVEIVPDGASDREGRGEVKEWSHVLSFYDWYWGHLPYDKSARDLLIEPLLEDQSCTRVQLHSVTGDEVLPVVVHYPSERQLGWWGSTELRNFFDAHELVPGATIRVTPTSSSESDGLYKIDYLPGPATKIEMLDYEEGGQPVFRRVSLKCRVDEERSLTRARFSALEALRLLNDNDRRVTSSLLKNAFERVGEKLLRGLGIVYRASFTDLHVAANIERPLPATTLEAIFQQGVYPCFYIDEDGYYVYSPGRSDVQVDKVRLTWDEAVLDSRSLEG